jgi:catechol 2,3-dioxygenase-like lactoylglutathione lyase family enzyme
MIRHIDHVNIVVDDMEAMIAFYRDLLGMKLTLRSTLRGPWIDCTAGLVDVNGDVAFLELPDGPRIELLRYRTPNGSRPEGLGVPNAKGLRHFALRVVELDALVAAMSATGVHFLSEVQQAPLDQLCLADLRKRMVYCRDPSPSAERSNVVLMTACAGGVVMKTRTVLIVGAALTIVALSWSSAQAVGIRIGIGIPIGIGVGIGPAYPAPYYYRPYPYYYPYYYPYRYYYPYPYGYAVPAPVYVQPAPVYPQPAPTLQRSYYPPGTVPPPPTPAPPTPIPAPTARTLSPPSSAPQPVAPMPETILAPPGQPSSAGR